MGRTAVDLNADLGEGEPHDAALLGIVSSCNIACGGHTGDVASMTETVRLANRHNVSVGAHPSYPDPAGFGRRSGFMAGEALLASLRTQVESLVTVCEQEDCQLVTLKPHGALYNDATNDSALAELLVQLSARFGLTLIGLPDSATEREADRQGVRYLREGFVDRAYLPNGSLCPRDRDGAIIDDATEAAEQALRLATGRPVSTVEDAAIRIDVDTLCLHGDTPNAVEVAQTVQSTLRDAGVNIACPARD